MSGRCGHTLWARFGLLARDCAVVRGRHVGTEQGLPALRPHSLAKTRRACTYTLRAGPSLAHALEIHPISRYFRTACG
jgi:hypothetical protein